MIASRRNIVTPVLLGLGLFVISSCAAASAQVSAKSPVSVTPRVTSTVDNSKRTTLTGHIRPFLARATDNGVVDDTQKTGPIMLMFSRTAQQQADLDSLVDQLHNKTSPQFHQWLTPQQFGARFEPADSDVAAVKAWLVSQGFTVLDIVPSKAFISFEGTTGQLRAAFKTEIHHMSINGEAHMAATLEPQVPTALASVIGGLNKLDDFGGKPLYRPMGTYSKDNKTGKVTQTSGAKPVTGFTTTNANGTTYQVGPQDFYTIYNENPLLQAGITGAGQTIAVIEEVQVAAADVTTFRSFFGLPAYPATPNATGGGVNYLIGSSSGLNGYTSCYAPVTQAKGKSTEEGEADLDLQWAGAVAPNAIVDFVACGGTKTNGDGTTLGALGIDHSAQYVANYLYTSVSAASMSYGECEADMNSSNTSGVGYYNAQWEQYAAEGITAIISSGDGGAEQCYQNGTNATTLPPSANGFGSSAYNISAGGTDFGDLYETNNYTTSPATTWWNATNSTGQSSAVTYVPETTWAGYCSSNMFASYLQSGGSITFGSVYTPEAICSNATAKTDGYLAVVGGAGGISTFNTIPTWQSVYGVGLNSVSSTYRNLPDISMYASNGFWGHILPYCQSDEAACTLANYSATTDYLGAGGTSFVAPQLAGFMALVNQKTGSRQGQANYTLYALAAQEYGTPGNPASSLASCSGSAAAPGQRPPSSCFFNDVSNDMPSLQGGTLTVGIYQPCLAGDIDCFAGNGGSTYGVNTVPGTTASAGTLGFTASPGYDDATGLGSLNISGIVQGWNSVTTGFASTTALAASSTKLTSSASTTLTATVMATGRGGTVAPAGSVTFYVGSSSGTNLGTGTITSTCTGTGASTACKGTATVSVAASALSTGYNSIVAVFPGDGANDAPSTSPAVNVGVYGSPVGVMDLAVAASTGSSTVAQNDSLYTSGYAGDPVDGSPLTNVLVLLDGTGTTPTLGLSRPDLASVNASYTHAGWQLSYNASGLSLGSHTVAVRVTNGGGTTFTSNPLTITVVAATPVAPVPVGYVDTVMGSASQSTTIPQSDALVVSGWAADPKDGSPLSNVIVMIDGTTSYTPTLGLSRPDVASATGNSSYGKSGYYLALAASSLSQGTHTVSVVATNSSGTSTNFGSTSISIVPGTKPPTGNLDLVADSLTGSTTIISKLDMIYVSGWAADYGTNGNVATVTIYADGVSLGTATLGQSRPDVASAYNDPSWSTTGFVTTASPSSLTAGSHTISALATDHAGLVTNLGSSTITIVP